MNQEIKQLWIKELKSGNYKQTTGRLHKHDRFCVLGVLCDIHSKQYNIKWKFNSKLNIYTYFGQPHSLPNEVIEWSQLKNKSYDDLIDYNDQEHLNFEDLSKLIEINF